MNNNLQKYKNKQILMLVLELLSLVLSIFNLLFLIPGLVFGIIGIYYFIRIIKEKRKSDNLRKNIKEESKENKNLNNDYIPKKNVESNLRKEKAYIESFKEINIYDMRKTLKEEFIKKLKRNKELEYESFIKQSGTTSRPNDFVVFDLETTGLSPDNSEIIELGAIKFKNNKPVEIFHTYIKPNKKISKKITNINGITNEMVEESPSIEEVIPKFIDFIENDVLIAHNSSFDMKFILSAIYHQGYKKIKNKTIDTLKLSRQKIRDFDNNKLSSYKLEKLKNIFNLNDLGSHNAIDDCKVCAYVYIETKDLGEDFLCLRSS